MTTRAGLALAGAAALLAGWLATLAAVMLLSDAAPAALVLVPSADFVSALPADVAILSRGPFWITLTAEEDLAARLYASGAWLVLPSGLSGCAPAG
jgi:hypothetical protein